MSSLTVKFATPALKAEDTLIRKGLHGWRADTELDLGLGYVLKLSTYKSHSGYLGSYASIHQRENGFLSHMVFQDYSERWFVSKPKRLTSKEAELQHHELLGKLPEIMVKVNAQYGVSTETAPA